MLTLCTFSRKLNNKELFDLGSVNFMIMKIIIHIFEAAKLSLVITKTPLKSNHSDDH